jgi:hypothetical protein
MHLHSLTILNMYSIFEGSVTTKTSSFFVIIHAVHKKRILSHFEKSNTIEFFPVPTLDTS